MTLSKWFQREPSIICSVFSRIFSIGGLRARLLHGRPNGYSLGLRWLFSRFWRMTNDTQWRVDWVSKDSWFDCQYLDCLTIAEICSVKKTNSNQPVCRSSRQWFFMQIPSHSQRARHCSRGQNSWSICFQVWSYTYEGGIVTTVLFKENTDTPQQFDALFWPR